MKNQETKSAYDTISERRALAKNKLRDLIIGAASKKEIQEVQAEFDILDEKVRRIDRAVGDYSKDEGNYPSTSLGFFRSIGVYFLLNKIWSFFKLKKGNCSYIIFN